MYPIKGSESTGIAKKKILCILVRMGWTRRVRRTNEQVLRALVEKHGLDRDRVADLTRSTPHTAKAWMRSEDNAAHRRIPDGLLELLCLKLGEESPFRD